MTIGIDGLISGLDTTTLINNLVAAESQEQTLLSTKATGISKLVSSFQSLNSQLAALTGAAKSAGTAASWDVFTATSSSSSVSVTAGTGAAASSLSLTVQQVARAQVSLIDAADLAGQSALTFTMADGTSQTVTIDGDHPADIAQAINDAKLGISASLVRVSGTGDTSQYVLQLTGATGQANAFGVAAGTGAEGESPTAVGTVITTAQDASVVLWSGTGAERTVTSATNTFEGLLSGTTITVSAASADPVTISLTPDTAARTALVTGMVAQVATVISAIAAGTKQTTTTDDDGNTVVTGGIYAGDTAVRSLTQDLISAFTYPVDGKSPTTVLGISVDKDGTISIDQEVLAASLADDPEGTMAFATALSARVQAVGTTYSDPIDGLITTKITGQQSVYTDLEQRIGDWDTRIAARKATLQAKFNAMETTLQSLKTTSDWLTTQLANLVKTTSNNS